MTRYFLKRLILMIPTFIAILLAAYLIVSRLPSARADALSAYRDGDALDAVFEKFDAPDNLATKFIRYCYDLIVYGDMGRTNVGSHVADEVAFRIKYTLLISALGFLASILIGIPLGFVSAMNHDRWPDHSVSFFSAFLASIPSFCLALFLVFIFCLWLDILPIAGMETWKGFVMPTIVLGAGGLSLASRMTRSAVLEILSKPYLTVLRAKGLSESKILFSHILKNAASGLLSVAGNIAVAILCSTLVVENFFSIPGIGSYIVVAVQKRDQQRLLGSIVVVSLIIMLIHFASDILSCLCSPKVRLQLNKKRSSGKGGAA